MEHELQEASPVQTEYLLKNHVFDSSFAFVLNLFLFSFFKCLNIDIIKKLLSHWNLLLYVSTP